MTRSTDRTEPTPAAGFARSTFETERLLLRPFELPDAPAVRRLAGAAEVARTAFVPHPYPEGVAETWIEAGHLAREAGTAFPFAMVQTDDNILVGCMALRLVPEHRRGELGYWVGHAYWGHGYATEAAARVIAFGFDDLALNRIESAAIHRNRSSTRVMEKCGLKYEGTLRQHIFHWGAFEDIDQYGLLRADSRAQRRGGQAGIPSRL